MKFEDKIKTISEMLHKGDYEKFTQKLHWYFAVLDLAILNKLEDEALEISNLLVCITDEMIKVRKDE